MAPNLSTIEKTTTDWMQARAAVEQAHAAWAQVWVGALSALFTLAAVIVALVLARAEAARRERPMIDALRFAADRLDTLHRELETNLLNVDPAAEQKHIAWHRKLLDYYLARDVGAADIVAVLMRCQSELTKVEGLLNGWQLAILPEGIRRSMNIPDPDLVTIRGELSASAKTVRGYFELLSRRGLRRRVILPVMFRHGA